MPDSEARQPSPDVIYGDGKKRILETVAGQSALPSELRAALADGIEKIFREFASRDSGTAASGKTLTAEEAQDSEVELRERLIEELVAVWNEAVKTDRHCEGRIQKLEQKGWFVSKAPSGVRFAKHPESEEVFILPEMPAYFKGIISNYFDTIDLTPNSQEERVVVGLKKPGIIKKEVSGRLLDRREDWNNLNEMPMLVAVNASGATKGLIEVKVY